MVEFLPVGSVFMVILSFRDERFEMAKLSSAAYFIYFKSGCTVSLL